ncbi:DUF397 domain-containing protein [Streptomyces sp. NPDC000351]|uniref:DUF397 domain-containing protein n=1 Tax=Streptomyces sp. NPDC000351 TaxID=3154250 RepID=UPI00331FAC6F
MPTADHHHTDLNWFKSSHSGGNTTECVEAAFVPSGVLIRDSKQPEGPCLSVSASAWRCFLTARPEPITGA